MVTFDQHAQEKMASSTDDVLPKSLVWGTSVNVNRYSPDPKVKT